MPETETERLSFPGTHGLTLTARLERPKGEPSAYALFAHCFTCSKDLRAVGWVSRTLAARGIAVLRFDFTGLGESEGDFVDTDFHSNLDDLVAAADFLRREYRAPQILIGHSLGGAAVIAGADRIPEAVAVATIGAPSDTEHLRDTLLRGAPELASEDAAEVTLAGRKFRLRKDFVDDLAEEHVQSKLAGLGRALLILHSPIDELVDVDHARRLYQGARHPKSFVSLDGADHLLTRERDARFAGEILASWAGRYVDPVTETESPQRAASAPPLPHGEVLVTGGPSGYQNQVQAGRHHLLADEPPGFGTDTGPSPYELLLAGLGACTSMTLRMYADRKNWPLTGVEVRLRHAKIHAEDCADCETKSGKVDRIEREVSVAGPLDDAQRARLLEIANKCPVHRTLESEINVQTRLVDRG